MKFNMQGGRGTLKSKIYILNPTIYLRNWAGFTKIVYCLIPFKTSRSVWFSYKFSALLVNLMILVLRNTPTLRQCHLSHPLFSTYPPPLSLRQCHLCHLLPSLLAYSVNAICLFSLFLSLSPFFSTLYRPLSILYDTLYLKCPLKTVNFTHDIIGLSILNIEWGLLWQYGTKRKYLILKIFTRKSSLLI